MNYMTLEALGIPSNSFLGKLLLKIFSKTTKIAILGPQDSGKTELWCALQNKPRTSINTSNEPIERFCLGSKSDGTMVYVEKTQDIGGGDEYVSKYDTVVTEGTFVYFVLDITKIGSAKYEEQLLAQFYKIHSNLEKIENPKFLFGGALTMKPKEEMRLIILATHIDQYRGDKSQGVKVVRDCFAPLESYGIDRTTLNVKLVNLKNASDIKEIREEVLKSVDK